MKTLFLVMLFAVGCGTEAKDPVVHPVEEIKPCVCECAHEAGEPCPEECCEEACDCEHHGCEDGTCPPPHE